MASSQNSDGTQAGYGEFNIDDTQMEWRKYKKCNNSLLSIVSDDTFPSAKSKENIFNRYNTAVSRPRNIPLTQTITSKSGYNSYERRDTFDPVFQALDENSPELRTLSEKKQLNILQVLRSKQGWTFDAVRDEYKSRKERQRENNIGHSWWGNVKTLLDYEFYKAKFLGFLNSKQRRILFIILDLIADALFCILYLVEMQISLTTSFTPKWLWIHRPAIVWYLIIAMTCENILSRILRIAFAQTNRWSVILSLYTFLDLVTGVPVISSLFLTHGQYLYVPYFLRSIVVVWRIKRALNIRMDLGFSDKPYDPLLMKLTLLVAYILIIVYNGMAAFQYFELMFADKNYNLIDSLYFTIITVSTVGYGDISPSSIPGKFVVIFLIIVVLTILPGLISDTLDTLNQKKAGGGSYRNHKDGNLVVICGVFDHVQRVKDILNGFLHQERESDGTKLLFLGRTQPSIQIKVLLNTPAYKSRVTFLQGSVLDTHDLQRASVQNARAVFILSDRDIEDSVEEDENNTLRTWAVHIHAPHIPIYTYNHHPFTAIYQQNVTTQTICPKEYQQALIGYNCLYRGSATLILNLLYNSQPIDQYSEPWQAQYDDGSGNEIYSGLVNPIFVGKPFALVSWYIYQEFQAILFAVNVYVNRLNAHHLVLNPGNNYELGPNDICYYISQGPQEIQEISQMTQSEFLNSLKHIAYLTSTERDLLTNPHVSSRYNQCQPKSNIVEFPKFNSDIIVGQPQPPYEEPSTPLCHLLKYPINTADKMVLDDARTMTGHILICAGFSDPFRLICTLRAAHITESEHRQIVILRSNPPSESELNTLSVFADVYFIMGQRRSEKDLIRAGILGANRIIILRKHDFVQKHDEYVDTSVIMCDQLARRILKQHDESKYIIVEIVEQTNVKLLQAADHQAEHKFTKVFTHASSYASGQVFVDCSIDHLFYQGYHNEAIMKLVRLLCGLRSQSDLAFDTQLNITSSYLCYIRVPDKFVDKAYDGLYRELAAEQGIVPLGLFRASSSDLGNTKPFVFTNPVPAILLRADDLVYVLKVSFD